MDRQLWTSLSEALFQLERNPHRDLQDSTQGCVDVLHCELESSFGFKLVNLIK